MKMNRKMSRRLTALFLIAALAALCVAPASAAPANDAELLPGISFSVGDPNGRMPVQTRNQQIYSETVGGTKDFSDDFGCYPGYGPEMRMTVTNTGDTTIYGVLTFITSDGETATIDDFVISPRSSNYVTANSNTDKGLTLTCNFMLSTHSATEGMYCTIYVEQGYGLA